MAYSGPRFLKKTEAAFRSLSSLTRQVSDRHILAVLARISHHLTVEARNRPAITALRLLAVLNVLFKYASARRAACALY